MSGSAPVLIVSALALAGCNLVFDVDGVGSDDARTDGGLDGAGPDGANAQCTPELVTDGLIGWYPMKALDDEVLPACAGPAGRCDPNSCPGVDNSGVYGSALRFTLGQQIVVPDNRPESARSSDLTVAFWLRAHQVLGEACPVRKVVVGETFDAWSLCLRGDVDGTVTAVARWADKTRAYVETMPVQIATGAWIHVAMRTTGTRVELFIDDASVDQMSIGTFLDAGTELRLGADGIGETAFDGALADLRIYNRALSDVDIGMLAMK